MQIADLHWTSEPWRRRHVVHVYSARYPSAPALTKLQIERHARRYKHRLNDISRQPFAPYQPTMTAADEKLHASPQQHLIDARARARLPRGENRDLHSEQRKHAQQLEEKPNATEPSHSIAGNADARLQHKTGEHAPPSSAAENYHQRLQSDASVNQQHPIARTPEHDVRSADLAKDVPHFGMGERHADPANLDPAANRLCQSASTNRQKPKEAFRQPPSSALPASARQVDGSSDKTLRFSEDAQQHAHGRLQYAQEPRGQMPNSNQPIMQSNVSDASSHAQPARPRIVEIAHDVHASAFSSNVGPRLQNSAKAKGDDDRLHFGLHPDAPAVPAPHLVDTGPLRSDHVAISKQAQSAQSHPPQTPLVNRDMPPVAAIVQAAPLDGHLPIVFTRPHLLTPNSPLVLVKAAPFDTPHKIAPKDDGHNLGAAMNQRDDKANDKPAAINTHTPVRSADSITPSVKYLRSNSPLGLNKLWSDNRIRQRKQLQQAPSLVSSNGIRPYRGNQAPYSDSPIIPHTQPLSTGGNGLSVCYFCLTVISLIRRQSRTHFVSSIRPPQSY